RPTAVPIAVLGELPGLLELVVQRHAVLRVASAHLGALLRRREIPERSEHLLGLAIESACGSRERTPFTVGEHLCELRLERRRGRRIGRVEIRKLVRVPTEVVELGARRTDPLPAVVANAD